MKRYIIPIFLILFLSAITGCTESTTEIAVAVPAPMQRPDYTFTETPNPDTLRKTAVQAMQDLLSIQWTPADSISYYNTAGRDKQFDYLPGNTYGGLLYSGAGSGLFQFFEFYDSQTGQLKYPGTGDELRKNIGSSCADSLLWSWATVTNSVSCGYYPSAMVYKNGLLPVGDYTYDFSLNSYYMLPTKDIIAENGSNIIFDAYSKLLPADAVISSSVDHSIMVIKKPVVTYFNDGTIDPSNSYVYLQEQRGGNTSKTFYEINENGHTVYYNSLIGGKMNFQELLEKNYIPVTTAEFIGEKVYEKATVTIKGNTCTSFEDLADTTIESNYPLAFIDVVVTDLLGKEVELDKILFHGASTVGPPRSYNLSNVDILKEINHIWYKNLRIEVTVSTGETFIPINISI